MIWVEAYGKFWTLGFSTFQCYFFKVSHLLVWNPSWHDELQQIWAPQHSLQTGQHLIVWYKIIVGFITTFQSGICIILFPFKKRNKLYSVGFWVKPHKRWFTNLLRCVEGWALPVKAIYGVLNQFNTCGLVGAFFVYLSTDVLLKREWDKGDSRNLTRNAITYRYN